MKTIRLGTRPSALAMWQANWTRDALTKLGVDVEIVKIVTSGDVNRAAAIANLGAQGVFTKEIQRALLNGEIDVAAHSLKDLPVEKIPGLKLAAVPAREDPRDVFVSNRFASLDELPQGAKIGTSSMRRKSMLLQYGAKRFPDTEGDAWDVRDIRGNVETRLKKLDDGEFDALVLASAGLKRLGFESRIRSFLEKPDFLPAVGQGALGLETREDDLETVETIEKISDSAAMLSVLAERALLAELQGGCLVPIGAQGALFPTDGGVEILSLDSQILSFDGKRSFQTTSIQIFDPSKYPSELPFETKKELAEILGRGSAQALMEQGAADLVEEIRRVRDERNEKLRKRPAQN